MAPVTKTSADRTTLIDTIRRSLGGSMVDIELDAEDYHLAIDKALEQFKSQSEASTESSTLYLDLSDDQNEFILPEEIIEVRQIFRRSTGTLGAGGSEIDPFELAWTNLYLLQAGSTSTGGIATYYMFTLYQEELGKLFGLYINFEFNSFTKKLTLIRRPRGQETILLWVHNERPEIQLLNDRYTSIWIRDWSIAECKEMMGNAYRKYNTIPGPSGVITLPGTEMLNEAKEMKDDLRERLRNFESGEEPAWWVIG